MSTVKQVQNLRVYQGESENVKTFHWTLQFDSHVSSPSVYDYDLEIDNSPSFNTVNLKTYNKNDVNVFQDGDVVKGYEITIPKRQYDGELTYYCRIRINGGGFRSSWTTPITFKVNQNYVKQLTDYYFKQLADDNFYPKDVNSTNVYYIMQSYLKECDLLKFELDKLKSNRVITLCQDSEMYNYFGYLIQYIRPLAVYAAEYRERVIQLWDKFITYPATVFGLTEIIKMWTCEAPVILALIDQQDWVLDQNYLYDPNFISLQPYVVFNSVGNGRGFAVKIYIYNSWGFTLDKETIERFIHLFKPFHVKVYIEYSKQITRSVFFDLHDDWSQHSLTNLDIESEQDSVQLLGSNLIGYGITQTLTLAGVTSFSTIEGIEDLDSGSIRYYIRSSADEVTWSDWENVINGEIPVSTPVRQYVQLKYELERVSTSYYPKLESLRFNYRGI